VLCQIGDNEDANKRELKADLERPAEVRGSSDGRECEYTEKSYWKWRSEDLPGICEVPWWAMNAVSAE
jgi:hypothetical protein